MASIVIADAAGWVQTYNPTGSMVLSTLIAASPVVILLGLLGLFRVSAPKAAFAGLGVAVAVAVVVYGMPVRSALAATAYGAAFGLFPIGWIVLVAIFLYSMCVETGKFEIVKDAVAAVSGDRRVQALLIAFSFGAFLEGAAGFGTPVAISAALMIGTGFNPLHAAGLALIANTSPVAFGALGTPIITLASVTKLDQMQLSAMAGRQLPLFSLIVPAWLVWTMAGWRGVKGVWPAIVVAGGSFAVVQFLVSNFWGPTLVDVAGGLVSLLALGLLLRVWRPSNEWRFEHEQGGGRLATDVKDASDAPRAARAELSPATTREPGGAGALSASAEGMLPGRGAVVSAWVPWVLLSVCVFVWGVPAVKKLLDGGDAGRGNLLSGWTVISIKVPYLHDQVYRDVPVVPARGKPEEAVFRFNWLSATGTGILSAAMLSALWLGIGVRQFWKIFFRTVARMRWPLATIASMLALAYVARYSGIDATLGLAFTKTGVLYPFFAAMLGWLGVALTGSDTSSNALFGSLQRITAEQLGLSPVLMATANSTGGVMGKMIDAQSIVVSAAATGQYGEEGRILRFVFWHSLTLAALMGLVVLAQAYLVPWMVPK